MKTVRCASARGSAEPLHRAHRLLGKHRDDVTQRTAEGSAEEQRQDVAQDRDRWTRSEGLLVRRVLHNTAMQDVPHAHGAQHL